MPRLSTVTRDTVTLSVPLGGGDALSVEYRPSVLTPRLLRQLQAAELSASISDGLLGPLSELLVSWDLTTDDDAPIPTTAEALADIPFTVLLHVMLAIANSAASEVNPEPAPIRRRAISALAIADSAAAAVNR